MIQKSHRLAALLLSGSVTLLLSLPALAGDVATAEALFKKGITDMEAGKFDVACLSIAESNRLDPRPGTLFTLADCESKAGRIATAVALYNDYLLAFSRMPSEAQSKHLERSKIATAQRDALTPQIPELTLKVSGYSSRDVRVTRDGVELTSASLGIALPVDPGEHVVTAGAPSGPVTEERFTLDRGERKTIELAVSPPPAQKPQATPAPTSAGDDGLSSGARSDAVDEGSAQRTSAYIVGALGITGLAVWGVTGAVALTKKSVIDENCVSNVCNAEGKAAGDTAFTMSVASTIGLAAGVAGVGAGVVLLVTAPRKPKAGGPRGRVEARPLVLSAGLDGAVLGMMGVF